MRVSSSPGSFGTSFAVAAGMPALIMFMVLDFPRRGVAAGAGIALWKRWGVGFQSRFDMEIASGAPCTPLTFT
jgi:hypothetical protein